jgi:hypothetical protein
MTTLSTPTRKHACVHSVKPETAHESDATKPVEGRAGQAYCCAVNWKRASLLVLFLAAQSAVWWFVWQHNPMISEENSIMENFQVVCLLLGITLLAWTVVLRGTVTRREVLLGLALLYATFLILEVDTRGWNAPWLSKVFNGRIRDLWLGSLWLALAITCWRNATLVWKSGLSWLCSPSGALTVLAGLFWVASSVVDKLGLFPLTHHFPEELLETNATLLMILAAARIR